MAELFDQNSNEEPQADPLREDEFGGKPGLPMDSLVAGSTRLNKRVRPFDLLRFRRMLCFDCKQILNLSVSSQLIEPSFVGEAELERIFK